MRALQDKGWEIHPQVGVSFFRVDLGIVHPDFPGRYLAGVECDGATYHRSATARDRDRLREMVLNGLGWKIRRIWSTDWWMDASSAVEKIHARLTVDLDVDRTARTSAEIEEEALDNEAPTAAETAAADADEPPKRAEVASSGAHEPPRLRQKPANDREPIEEHKVYARGPESIEPGTATTLYSKADPSIVAVPDRDRFYDIDYRTELRSMVDHVIEIEGPIYFDVLIERIARAHGFQRSGENVQRIIRAALGRQRFPATRDGEREIIWPQNATPCGKIPYRGAGGREHSDVPLPELAGLADLLRSQGLEDGEDLIRGIQEHFELGRLAVSTRLRFESAIASGET